MECPGRGSGSSRWWCAGFSHRCCPAGNPRNSIATYQQQQQRQQRRRRRGGPRGGRRQQRWWVAATDVPTRIKIEKCIVYKRGEGSQRGDVRRVVSGERRVSQHFGLLLRHDRQQHHRDEPTTRSTTQQLAAERQGAASTLYGFSV